MTSQTNSFVLSAKASTLDPRDYLLKIEEEKRLPPRVDLSSHCTKIKNQNVSNNCVAYACVAAIEYLQKKFGISEGEEIFSEDYVTRMVKKDRGDIDCSRDVISALRKYGVCKEKNKNSNDADIEAARYQVISYARIEESTDLKEQKTNMNIMKTILNAGIPLIVTINCYENIWKTPRGVLQVGVGNKIGGHTVLIVGYDDSSHCFKFKNSWGHTWGVQGYGYLPYDYYFSGDMFDIWCVHKSERDDTKTVGVDVFKGVQELQELQELKEAKSNNELTDNLKDVFSTLLGCVELLNDRDNLMTVMFALQQKHKNNKKIMSLVNSIKGHMLKLVREKE